MGLSPTGFFHQERAFELSRSLPHEYRTSF